MSRRIEYSKEWVAVFQFSWQLISLGEKWTLSTRERACSTIRTARMHQIRTSRSKFSFSPEFKWECLQDLHLMICIDQVIKGMTEFVKTSSRAICRTSFEARFKSPIGIMNSAFFVLINSFVYRWNCIIVLICHFCTDHIMMAYIQSLFHHDHTVYAH